MVKYGLRFSLAAASIIVMTSSSFAESTRVYYQNASGLGNAYSGIMATADDVSTEYYNPAGLTRFDHPQLVIGGVGTRYGDEFVGRSTNVITGQTQTGTAVSHTAIVPWPFFYYGVPLWRNTAFGFGINVPFGIGDNFSGDSIVRYSGTRYTFATLNFSPAIAYQYNKLSTGFGLDIERLSVVNDSMFPSTGAPDAKILTDAIDWSYGWHLGWLYDVSQATRVGFGYHSKVLFNPHGKSRYVTLPGVAVTNEFVGNNFKFNAATPPFIDVSLYHDLNAQWALLATVDYTQWNMIQHLYVRNLALSGGSVSSFDVPLYFHDTWRFALGTNYTLNDNWLLRAGIAREGDPTNDNDRTAIIPATGSVSMAVGARYRILKTLSIDLGYEHFWMHTEHVNNVGLLNTEVGTPKLAQDSVAAQLTWDI